MLQNIVPSPTNYLTPAELLRRRNRLPRSTANTISELAFAGRIATLGDHGRTLSDQVVEARR